MKHVSRRDFIHSGCVATAITLAASSLNKVEAGFRLHGSAATSSQNPNGLNINAVPFYANLAKAVTWVQDATPTDANGYPTSNITTAWTSQIGLAPNYTGSYRTSWSGAASLTFNGPAWVIFAGSSFVSGQIDGPFSLTMSGSGGQVDWQFGYNIQTLTQSPVSNGSGGNLIRVTTKTGYYQNGATGDNVVISGQTGQAAATGNWLTTKIDNQTFDLQGSTWNVGQGSGTGGTAIIPNVNPGIAINSGTGSGFGALIVCTASNIAVIASGQLTDPLYLSQMKALKPSWIRFMDLIGTQQSVEYQFARRTTSSALSYSTQKQVQAYQVGAITWSTGDVYTCSNPSNSGTGAYADNEIVQGVVSFANTGNFPTLNVNGRGAAPIFDGSGTRFINLGGSVPANGTVIPFTFAASWLNGGSTLSFNYSVTSSDTSLAVLTNNIASAMVANSTLSAAGLSKNNGSLYFRTPLAGALTIAYTGSISGFTCSLSVCNIGTIVAQTTAATFNYNALLGGWEFFPQARFAAPYEYMVELCNACNAGCWYTWTLTSPAQYITDITTYFAQNLTVPFGGEHGNEMWNSGLVPWRRAMMMGGAIGTGPAGPYGFTGARFLQYTQLARTAWAAVGRAASDFRGLLIGWVSQPNIGNTTDLYLYQAQANTGSVFTTFGGIGGTSTAAQTASGSRPVDNCDGAGVAYYWGSHWWGGCAAGDSNPIIGTVTQNAPWLQAGLDYANGNTATAFTSLVNQFTGATASTINAGGMNWSDAATIYAQQETMFASYTRPGPTTRTIDIFTYEGAPQWGLSNNLINGTNGTAPADIAPLAAQITALGWNISSYTVSGTNNATECATQVIKMAQGWKLDIDINGLVIGTHTYKNMIKTYYYTALRNASPSRTVHAGQYGYNGNAWGLFPKLLTDTPYESFAAIAEYDAGI